MSKQATIKVGLIGLGTVGSGVARLLTEPESPRKPTLRQKTGIDIQLTRIATRTPSKTHGLSLPAGLVTNDVEGLLNDPSLDIVVECIGGVEPAKTFLTRAIQKGKAVISANKMLFALHGPELCKLALQHETSIGFEAAVAGGIPIISILRDDLIGNRIDKLMGIVNGTCNYILTRMVREGKPYKEIIGEAVKLGYAETDPTLDVSGLDAAHKLAILASLAFHTAIDFNRIHVEGIQTLRLSDINFARELGYEVKLIALAQDKDNGIDLRVHPTLLRREHPLSAVMDVFNSVFIHGDAVGDQMFYGRGAGQLPTGSAVVADIVDAARGSAKRTFRNLQYFRTAAEQHRYVKIGDVNTQYFISLR
ncbi:MAG TPA: homoserine dehydrogenase, partial [Planctomycetota bacterium]|nr:homoserine dehydrogenase [Planctomycetota bacterium]